MSLKQAQSESPVIPSKRRAPGSTPGRPPARRHGPQVTRVIQGKSRQIDLKNGPPLVEYPPLDIFWVVFGDHASTQFLKSSPTLDDYERNVEYFHGRMSLVLRGLRLDEISTLFRATLPAWYAHEEQEVQEAMSNFFEGAYDWVQDQIIAKVKAYSALWFRSESGSHYKTKWEYAE